MVERPIAGRTGDRDGRGAVIKFDVTNRFTGAVQFTAEIECDEGAGYSVKLGLAVQWAIKSRTYLSGADLSGADLSGAYLSGAYLSGAKDAGFAIASTRILPEGALIGWKKCRSGVIVKLAIPETAKRSSAFGRKCRAEYVDVLEMFGGEVGISEHDGKTEYRVGKRVTPDQWDENWQQECAGGIHFYITRLEAENH